VTAHATPRLDELAAVYLAGSEVIRLRILGLLAHGEQCVCHIHGLLEVPQPTVSRHLAILRRAGLVSARRDGSWVHYSLTDLAESSLGEALAAARADRALARRCRDVRKCT
jgi:ArsR family transcriptional regulator